MKNYLYLAFGLFLIGCGGCAQVTQERVSVTTNGRGVMFYAREVDDHTLEIIAYGDSRLVSQQVVTAWKMRASEIAPGRPYEQPPVVEIVDGGGVSVNNFPASSASVIKVSGRIALK